MARTRLIDPDLLLDEALSDADRDSGLPVLATAMALACFADREGRFDATPRRLRAQLFPYRGDLDMAGVLRLLEACGQVVLYHVDGHEYGQLTEFAKVQRPHKREMASTLPEPPEHEGQPKADQGVPKADLVQQPCGPDPDLGPHGSSPKAGDHADLGQLRIVPSAVSDPVSRSDPDTKKPPPRAGAREGGSDWSEDRLREHLPASCHEALRLVLHESGRGARGAVLAIAQMTGLEPNAIPTGPGMTFATPEEMAQVLSRMATATNPGWHQTMATRCLEAVRRERDRPPAASPNGTGAPRAHAGAAKGIPIL